MEQNQELKIETLPQEVKSETTQETSKEGMGVSFNTEDLKKCMQCEVNLKHTEVVLMAVTSENKVASVHTKCLTNAGNKIKQVVQIHVNMDKDRKASNAQQLIIKKKVREILKIAAKVEQRQKAEKEAQVKV